MKVSSNNQNSQQWKQKGIERPHENDVLNKNMNKNNQQWRLNGIEKPHENDILCGRGGTSIHSNGNKRFRAMVKEYKMEYQTYTRYQKTTLAETLLNNWREQNPPGRFLDKDERTGLWFCIPTKAARKKISQLLREGAPKIRTQLKTEYNNRRATPYWQPQPPTTSIVTPPTTQKNSMSQASTSISPPLTSRTHSVYVEQWSNENKPPRAFEGKPETPQKQEQIFRVTPLQASSPESVLDFDLQDLGSPSISWDQDDAFDEVFCLEEFRFSTEQNFPKPQVLQFRAQSNESASSATKAWLFQSPKRTSLTTDNLLPVYDKCWEPFALNSPAYLSKGTDEIDTSTIDILDELDQELEKDFIDGFA